MLGVAQGSLIGSEPVPSCFRVGATEVGGWNPLPGSIFLLPDDSGVVRRSSFLGRAPHLECCSTWSVCV